MKSPFKSRKLRLETLEERALLAVTAGAPGFLAADPEPTEAAVWTVNTADDPGRWDTTDDVVSLREAIGRAQTGDTIAFDESLAGGRITLSGNQLEITKAISIDARGIGGITIDAAGKSRVFYISGWNTANPVELIGLTITGGYVSNDDGGGIYNDGGTLTLTNCAVSGNTADSSYYYYSTDGGGIYNRGTLTLTNSTVSGNSASSGGGINSASGTLKITNTIVSLNFANNDHDLYIDSTFSGSNNIIGLDPGFAAAPVFESGKLVNGEQLDFSLTAASVAIDRGTNDAVTAETDLAGNPRIFAAWREPATVDIGAYEYQERVEQEAPSTVVTTSLDVVDAADGLISLREAIFYASPGETVTFDESLAGETITLNGTQFGIYEGIAIDAASIGGITIDANGKSRVFYINGGNAANPVELIGLTITGGYVSNGDGGGIYNYGTLTLTGSAVSGNTASSGGGIYNRGTLTLTSSAVSGNVAVSSGGGISNSGTLTLTNGTVSGNTGSYGGGIYNPSGTLKITNTILSLNFANDGADFYSCVTFSGSHNIIGLDPGFAAAPVFRNGKLVNGNELDFSLMAASVAIDRGTNDAVTAETDLAGNPRIFAAWREPATVDIGAYEYQERVEQEQERPSTVVTTSRDIFDVTDGLISLREAIFYASPGETVTFDRSLAGETITLNGRQLEIYGGIAIDAASVGGITIDANGKSRVFYVNGGNTANPAELIGLTITGGSVPNGEGGGIDNWYGALILTDSTVSRNFADSGGGIYNCGLFTLANSTVSENSVSGSGGGIYNCAATTVNGSTVAGNTADFFGGGLYDYGTSSSLTVTNSMITENTARYGGGISNDFFGTLTVTGSFIVKNTAIGGGGIDNYEFAAAAVTDSVIAGNAATGGRSCNGGGISNAGALSVIGSTITGNAADLGGGIYSNDAAALSLTNTIVSLNCADSWDNVRDGSEPFSGSNNIVGFDPGFVAAPVFVDGKLVNADELDLSLTEESLAIDTGLNDAVTTEIDIAGNPRIFAAWREPATVDIGAYEYQKKTERETEIHSTVVTTTLDVFVETDGLISLREAIFYAKPGETVTFDGSLAGETITLDGTPLEIDKGIAIDASSIGGITIDANNESRVFHIDAEDETKPIELIGLTITGGNAGSRDGGGIYVQSGTLKVTESIISGNIARSGGGICNSGTLTVTGSVISGNAAGNFGDGGGIYNFGGTLTVIGSTISGNSSGPIGYGGGIYSPSGTLRVTNTIVSLNYTKFYGEIYSASYTGSNNIVGLDPGFTVAPVFVNEKLVNADEIDLSLAAGSLAIDAGLNSAVTTETDIAGNRRIVNGVVDIGAYEYQEGEPERLAAPMISTGSAGVYVSYGANRHQLAWNAVENASGYEVEYTASGVTRFLTAADPETVIRGLTYGADVTYRVRALGDGVSYADSDWSAEKTFNVCPMDVNNDGDISGADRILLVSSWLTEEGDDDYRRYADIDGNGDVASTDLAYLSYNWLGEPSDDDLVYPRPLAADAVFADYQSGDLDVDLDVF